MFLVNHIKHQLMLLSIKLLIILTIISGLSACGEINYEDQKLFITRDGLEPDRWAAIWLVKTFISPQSEIIIKQPGSKLQGGTLFAVSESKYKRTQTSTAFSSMVKAYKLNDPKLIRMSEILSSIETASWSIAGTEADAIEQSFRRLQEKHRKYDVPIQCYMSFFDELYNKLKLSGERKTIKYLLNVNACESPTSNNIKRVKQANVIQIQTKDLLNEISSGKNIIFVDARRIEEFRTIHIPGAINITLSEINSIDLKIFESADRVVSYCIKDFRGYEVARALAKKGVNNSSTMVPYGLAGWKSLGLPVILNGQKDRRLDSFNLYSRNQNSNLPG